jgi:hypothetical protein
MSCVLQPVQPFSYRAVVAAVPFQNFSDALQFCSIVCHSFLQLLLKYTAVLQCVKFVYCNAPMWAYFVIIFNNNNNSCPHNITLSTSEGCPVQKPQYLPVNKQDVLVQLSTDTMSTTTKVKRLTPVLRRLVLQMPYLRFYVYINLFETLWAIYSVVQLASI